MNLRKIIREEIDDLDWIRDIKGGVWQLPRNRKWMIILGDNYTEQQWDHIIKIIDEHGWDSSHVEKEYSTDITAISYDGGMDGYTYWRVPESNLPIENYIGYGKKLYDIKDLL